MTDGNNLLAAILADPADDTARLVYADWLQDNDQPERAEFIRVQIELARLESKRTAILNDEVDWNLCDTESGLSAGWCPNCGDCSCPNREESMSTPGCPLHDPTSPHCCKSNLEQKAAALRDRERELLKAHIGAWTDGLPECFVTKECPSCVDQAPDWETNAVECRRCDGTGLVFDDEKIDFTRGFISHVTCITADWLRNADAMRAAQPIQTVFLVDWNGLLPPPLWIAGDLTVEESWHTFTSERFKGILFRDLAGISDSYLNPRFPRHGNL